MQNEAKKVSIIVPIYNDELYLERCLESISKQTYKEIEVILINDGSTDSSAEICHKYADSDDRFIYRYQENQGLVAARKAGLKNATGEYVGFVDSDDWIEIDTYEHYMKIAHEYMCDIITSGLYYDYENNRQQKTLLDNFNEGYYSDLATEIYPSMIYDFNSSRKGLIDTLCCRLFRKSIFEEVYSRLDDRITFGEDASMYAYMVKAKDVYVSKKVTYHYFIHQNSMCRRVNPNMIVNNHILYEYLFDSIKDNICFESLRIQLNRYFLDYEIHNLKRLYGIEMEAFAKWDLGIVENILNSRIIIYGASACGQAIYNKFLQRGKEKIIAWVDINWEHISNESGYSIKSPDILKIIDKDEFDYLIIATKSKNIAKELIDTCEKKYGIQKDKIIWDRYKSHLELV